MSELTEQSSPTSRGDAPPLGPLFAALAKAQAGFGPIERSRTVTVTPRAKGDGPPPRPYTFDYAPLDEILSKCLPALNANGLALFSVLEQHVEERVVNGRNGDYTVYSYRGTLTTRLVHESGAEIVAVAHPAGDNWQAFGSSVTYARRYTVAPLLGVSAEFDDDGASASGHELEHAAPRKQQKPSPAAASDAKAATKASGDAAPKKASPPKDGAPLTPETRALMVDHIRVLAEFRGKPDTPVGDIARELGGKADGFSEEEGQLLIKAAIAALNELPPAELECQLKAAAAKRAAKKAGQNG